MMTGFTKCGKCGSPVVGNMLAGGHLYYRCISTRPKAEGPATCHAPNIRADRLERVVWEMVSESIRHPEILSHEAQRHVQTGDGNLGERMTRLHSEIVDLKNQQRRLIEQRQKDIIDQEILESQIAPVKLFCEDKVGQLSALEDQQKSKDAAVNAEERIAEYCSRLAEGTRQPGPSRQEGDVCSLWGQGRSYARGPVGNFGDRPRCNDNLPIVSTARQHPSEPVCFIHWPCAKCYQLPTWHLP